MSELETALESPVLDHLVYATPTLEGTILEVAKSLGVAPSPGGQHVGRGTRNYLLALGAGSYLEIIGPDPEQPAFVGERPFGLNGLDRPRLLAWAVRVNNIDAYVQRARAAGYDPGPVQSMSRLTPDGELLHWRLTESLESEAPRLVPFLIDWGTTAHPSRTAASGVSLVELHAATPHPDDLQRSLSALGVTLAVPRDSAAGLYAKLASESAELLI